MTDLTKKVQGHIVSDSPRSVPSVPRADVSGPAIFVKWRYEAAKLKAESYTDFLRSLEDGVNAAASLERAIIAREQGLISLERIDDLRHIEHRRIDEMVDEAEYEVAARRAVRRTNLAALEVEALRAEARLKAVTAAPAEEADSDTRSPAEKVKDAIQKLRGEHNLIVDELKASAGDHFSEADQDTIDQMELVMHDRINKLMQGLRDQ